MRGAEHRGEDPLRDGASYCGVVGAGHLGGGHSSAERLLGAPVGGVEREVEGKLEDGRKLDTEMRRESLHISDTAGLAQAVAESLEEAPGRDRHPVPGDGPGPVSSPRCEGPAQNRLQRGRQRRGRMIADRQTTASQ